MISRSPGTGAWTTTMYRYFNVSLKDQYIRPNFPPRVGNTSIFPAMGTSALDHVVVSVLFTDGAAQVVLDTYI